MKLLSRLFRPLVFSLALGLPAISHASGADISLIFLNLIWALSPLFLAVATLVLVIIGFSLVLSHDEGRLEKTKTAIIGVVIGSMILTILMVFRGGPLGLISVVYNNVPGFVVINTGEIIGNEAIGIADWITAIAAMIGIFIIIVTVIRAILSFGDEASYKNTRTVILHIIIGFIVILAARILAQVLFVNHVPTDLIVFLAGRFFIILAIITTVALAVLVYAGLRMMFAFGDEGATTNAKNLVYRVLIGLIVIALSFALVWIVVLLFQ